MNRKRLPIWALVVGAVLCFVLAVLVLILPFLLAYDTIFSTVGGLSQGIEYPAELLDGNEDHLADLVVIGLPLGPVWEYQAPGPIDRPPFYRGGHVILKGDKVIWSVDANSGDEEWRHESINRIYAPYSDNIAILDRVLAYQTYPGPGQLQVIDLETGQERWETSSVINAVGSDNESRLFIAFQDNYRALDAEDGQVMWISEVLPPIRGGATLYDSSTDDLVVYAQNDTNTWMVLDSKTGRLLRKLNRELFGYGAPIIVDNGVLYAEEFTPARLFAVDGRENKALWTSDYPPPSRMFQPLVHIDILYITTLTGMLLAIDSHTGDIVWQYPSDTGSSVKLLSNVVVLDGIAYGIFSDAKLRGFDAITAQELGYIQFVDVSSVPYDLTVLGLASSDHLLFVSLGKTKLYAFEVIR